MSRAKTVETFHISTYGCQMNLADSSTLVSSLTTRGYRRIADEQEADLIVLNTCSVREKAEQRVLGRLGEIYRIKKRRPQLKIAVVGCMAQRLGDELVSKVPYVDYVLGTDRQFELPDVLEGREGTQAVMTAFGHENLDMIQPFQENSHSGFVTISRGCDNYCAYCIVPYVRGHEVTHSPEHIIDAVQRMVSRGVVEVTLLGQNVNSYSHSGIDFPDLLLRVVSETGVPRLRFMTSHPRDLSRNLVDVMSREDRIMPHIHLPLQSGSNRILQKMGREYTLEHYLETIEYIRSRLDYVVITTDLIVGFPSETTVEYEMTLDAVRRIRFDAAFMFRYSVRPGTAAASYDDDVPDTEKIRRLKGLIEIQKGISHERNQREVGRTCHCVVEGHSRRSTELMRARTEGNKIALFAADGAKIGSVVPTYITAADAFTLHGRQEEPN